MTIYVRVSKVTGTCYIHTLSERYKKYNSLSETIQLRTKSETEL